MEMQATEREHILFRRIAIGNCTISIWFISNKYLWGKQFSLWIKPLVLAMSKKKTRRNARNLCGSLLSTHILASVCCYAFVFVFFSMGLAVTSVFYHLVFVHIIALCDTVKLHANTSSNKTSSLFLSGLVMTTVCRRNFSVPYLIPASTSFTFFGSRVHFSANFIAHCCWLIYIFIFFFIHMSYMILTAAYFSISIPRPQSLFS